MGAARVSPTWRNVLISSQSCLLGNTTISQQHHELTLCWFLAHNARLWPSWLAPSLSRPCILAKPCKQREEELISTSQKRSMKYTFEVVAFRETATTGTDLHCVVNLFLFL